MCIKLHKIKKKQLRLLKQLKLFEAIFEAWLVVPHELLARGPQLVMGFFNQNFINLPHKSFRKKFFTNIF